MPKRGLQRYLRKPPGGHQSQLVRQAQRQMDLGGVQPWTAEGRAHKLDTSLGPRCAKVVVT